jgi:hypothetical protein
MDVLGLQGHAVPAPSCHTIQMTHRPINSTPRGDELAKQPSGYCEPLYVHAPRPPPRRSPLTRLWPECRSGAGLPPGPRRGGPILGRVDRRPGPRVRWHRAGVNHAVGAPRSCWRAIEERGELGTEGPRPGGLRKILQKSCISLTTFHPPFVILPPCRCAVAFHEGECRGVCPRPRAPP